MTVALIDMDGVVADISVALQGWISENFPDAVDSGPSDEFFFEKRYGLRHDDLSPFFESEGTFASFPLMEGAQKGVQKLVEAGITVKFCTAPVHESQFCASEKQVWINKFFPERSKDLIIAKDKTMVRGDILIDDKSFIKGLMKPEWLHVYYNEKSFTWDDVDELIDLLGSGGLTEDNKWVRGTGFLD